VPGDVERYAKTIEELLLDMNHIKASGGGGGL
jgi:hypothetical protein